VEEDRNAVYDSLSDSDLVFITAGMGGGTGTGASPVIADIARDIGALTVGIVTTPFIFEGAKRMHRAMEGIAALKDSVDTLIVIPNQRLLTIVPKNTPLDEGFRYADEILFNATRGISDLITVPGLVNLDFADVRAVMSESGDALMGCGAAEGEERARIAAKQAINSPLLEDVSISGALGLLVNITGGADLTLHEVSEAASIIAEEAGPKANVIFGAVIDKALNDEIRITVIATGLSSHILRPRLQGLNRHHINIPDPASISRKEIPAVDRMDEIGDRIPPRMAARSMAYTGSRTSTNVDVQKNDPKAANAVRREAPEHRDELRRLEDTEKPQNPFDVEDRNNGFSDNDTDIPACRRERWRHF
jgi:cell division protein FtsZ